MQENKLTHKTYTPVKWGPGYLGLFFSVTGFACLLSLPHICRQKKSLFNWDSKRWDHSLKGTIFYPPKAWNIRWSRTFECLKPKNSKIYLNSRHWKNPKHFNIRTWWTRRRENSKQEPLMKNTKFWRWSTGEVSVLLWQKITTSIIKLCLRG